MSTPQETEQIETPVPNGADTESSAIEPTVDDAPPVKRRRGRPPKDANAPQKESVGGAAPKRGRPAKSDKKVYSLDEIALMGKQLVGLHMMVAQIGGLPELQLADQEGLLLAQSIINVADQYDLAIDGKTGAALQLAMTAAMIYAPRALAIRARARQQQAAPAEAQGNGV